jgi:signal transduction histidine kinase
MRRLTVLAFCLLLVWVVMPLLLRTGSYSPEPQNQPLIEIQAANTIALLWFVSACGASALALTLAGFGWRGVRVRTGMLFLTVLIFAVLWAFIPTRIGGTAINPLILIRPLNPLALVWIGWAVAISALFLMLFGAQLRYLWQIRLQRRRLMRLVNENITEGIALYDRRGDLSWINAPGRSVFYVDDAPHPEVRRLVQRTLQTRRVHSQNITVNEAQRVSVQSAPIGGGMISLIGRPIGTDLGQFYDHFIRRIVHDMRNPLAAIIAHATNLQNAETPDLGAWQHSAQVIENEAQRLTRLVDSMLFDARLSYVPPDLQRIDLVDVIEDVLYQHDERAMQQEKNVEVSTPPTPVMLDADRDLITRALSNLVENSLKYSKPGASVQLILETTGNMAVVRVRDTGDGIPPEYLPDRIFEPLVRARAKDSGSGLGLAIVKKIAQLHGGTVSAESTLGKGTTITLCLPL